VGASPAVDRFRARVLKAYQVYGDEITKWGAKAGRGSAPDILEVCRRYAAGRRLAKRAIEKALEKLDKPEGAPNRKR
jgi:hypothetical protein